MKLSTLHEAIKNQNGRTILYKGMNEANFRKFRLHKIPGFLAEHYLAMVYAEPSLANEPDETMYFISVNVNLNEVVDMNGIVSDMCGDWNVEHPELRNKIWTAPGSAHGNKTAIYYGKPAGFSLIQIFHGQEDWEKTWKKFGYGQ